MAARAVTDREVSLEFVFERTSEMSLAQAYRILVPERRSRTRQKCLSGASDFGEARSKEVAAAEVTEIAVDRAQADRAASKSIELWVAQA